VRLKSLQQALQPGGKEIIVARRSNERSGERLLFAAVLWVAAEVAVRVVVGAVVPLPAAAMLGEPTQRFRKSMARTC
jgi:hypothetical protein